MRDQLLTPLERLGYLLTVPERDRDQVWPYIWRTLAMTLAGAIAVSLALGLVATLLVAAPHAIVTGRLGTTCVSTDSLDCTRALADARQSVLFSAGGLIALVGIVFTYLRWRAERDSTDEALEEGKRAAKRLEREGERHERDADQLEITRLTDALGLLESTDDAKRTAAISLLIDYAVNAKQVRYIRLILDVLISFLNREELDGYRMAQDQVSDERLPLSPAGRQALLGILHVTVTRKIDVDLAGLTFVGLEAPDSHWNYIRLRNVAFVRCDLTGADFEPLTRQEEVPKDHHARVRFQDCILTSAAFAEVRQSRCTYADTHGSTVGGRFDNIDFSGAQLYNVDFMGVRIYGDAFREATLHQVTFDGMSFLPGGSLIDATLNMVSFAEEMYEDPPTLITTRGNWKMRNFIPFGRVLRVTSDEVPLGFPVQDGATPAASSATARDSGETPGDSRTPEPSPTDESST